MEDFKKVGDLEEVGRNLIKIMRHLAENQDLLRLLVYTDKDPRSKEKLDLSPEDVRDKNIRIIPRKLIDDTADSVLIIRLVEGAPNENGEFRDMSYHIEIFVPLTQWKIKGTNLRPFSIMSETSKSLDGQEVEGLGVLELAGFRLNFLTEEMSSYEMRFEHTSYA